MVPVNSVSLALDILGSVLLIVLLYYASANLFLFREGKLEKSWRYMSRAVLILTLGVLLFALGSFMPADAEMPVMWAASTVMLIGTLFLLLGFRYHHRVWSGREFQEEKSRIDS